MQEMAGEYEGQQPAVVMKQGNTCRAKGHSQTIDGIMIEPDWEAVVHTWLTL